MEATLSAHRDGTRRAWRCMRTREASRLHLNQVEVSLAISLVCLVN